MANEKILNTRIQLKYDSLFNWNASTFKLKAGEVAIATLGETKDESTHTSGQHPVLFKVGTGNHTFAELPFVSALAADVYAWAKAETVIFDEENQKLEFKTGDKVIHSVDLSKFVTGDELTTILADYYTKNQIDALTTGKLHTEAEIKSFAQAEIERLIKAADDEGGETIESIANLVDYVEKNAGEIAGLITDVGTANTNASNAVTTANEAKELATNANTNATTALNTANSAKEIAETAQNSASASATAASESAAVALASQNAAASSASAADTSAQAAAGSASTATTQAGLATEAKEAAVEAKAAAESAKQAAESARANAVIAQSGAEDAQSAAEAAQAKAEEAQEAAEQAKADAEAAKQAALDSNASATAIANEAKSTAEEAKTASDAATEAVAGLHAIATSGSLYDAEEVNSGANDTKYFVFYCGTASELID